jgi:phosphogluconate dehydratase
MTSIHPIVAKVAADLAARSATTRAAYLKRIHQQRDTRNARLRDRLAATNLAHGYASLPNGDKLRVVSEPVPMLAIVSAYNDVLSAHQPLENYPQIIRDETRKFAAVAQFAGGVPAMCDGVTQGQPGMELSLFSRDVIAMSTAIALSHDLYDGVFLLGVCDKIVPGLLLGALSFGHLPAVFIPAGPMPTGLSNTDKSKVRKAVAAGKAGQEELLKSEMAAYHTSGTCTFYGTANSNQMLLEAMGLMVPGAAFVQPNDPRRELLTRAACKALAEQARKRANERTGLGEWIDEKVIVNAIVTLLATGGSTNHTMHWVAIARAAGWQLTWDDIDRLSTITPQLTRLYPNGEADVNDFDRVGGTAFLMRELIDAGYLFDDVETIVGRGLRAYTSRVASTNEALRYEPALTQSGDDTVLRCASNPFSAEGGINVLKGNLGQAVVKVSAVSPEHRVVRAPARVFNEQNDVLTAFNAGELTTDCVVVVRFQGPKARGMPELHKLTPALSLLLDRGLKVALVTDGRMSGASGKVPAAIHVTPEAMDGGLLAKLRDGDIIEFDCEARVLRAIVDADVLAAREAMSVDLSHEGWGREMFGGFRDRVGTADTGATVLFEVPSPAARERAEGEGGGS